MCVCACVCVCVCVCVCISLSVSHVPVVEVHPLEGDLPQEVVQRPIGGPPLRLAILISYLLVL